MSPLRSLAASAVVLGASAGAGCSKSEYFLGTWTPEVGSTTTVDCGTDGPLRGVMRRLERGDLTVVNGMTSDLVLLTSERCQVPLDVAGGSASLAPGARSCAVDSLVVEGATTEVSVTSATLTVRYDKETMTLVVSGTAITEGFTEDPCPFALQVAATKTGR